MFPSTNLRRPPPARFRPCVEGLESRLTPASIVPTFDVAVISQALIADFTPRNDDVAPPVTPIVAVSPEAIGFFHAFSQNGFCGGEWIECLPPPPRPRPVTPPPMAALDPMPDADPETENAQAEPETPEPNPPLIRPVSRPIVRPVAPDAAEPASMPPKQAPASRVEAAPTRTVPEVSAPSHHAASATLFAAMLLGRTPRWFNRVRRWARLLTRQCLWKPDALARVNPRRRGASLAYASGFHHRRLDVAVE